MNDKKLKYELTEEVVNYLLTAVNRTQIAGVQQAQSLLQVVEILQNPVNQDELEEATYKSLKEKFEDKDDKKSKK